MRALIYPTRLPLAPLIFGITDFDSITDLLKKSTIAFKSGSGGGSAPADSPSLEGVIIILLYIISLFLCFKSSLAGSLGGSVGSSVGGSLTGSLTGSVGSSVSGSLGGSLGGSLAGSLGGSKNELPLFFGSWNSLKLLTLVTTPNFDLKREISPVFSKIFNAFTTTERLKPVCSCSVEIDIAVQPFSTRSPRNHDGS